MPERRDRRFKDPDKAPTITSEKRMTFFLSEKTFRSIRLQTGFNQIANAENDRTDDPLPENPSAAVREAVQLWLDQFAPAREQSRKPAEWDKRLDEIRKALGKTN